MKLRTKRYFSRKNAIRDMIRFRDLKSFLRAGFELSRSLVVKKDMLQAMLQFETGNRNKMIKHVQ